MKIMEVDKAVLSVLKKSKASRSDDFLLYVNVCREFGVDVTERFDNVLTYHKESGIPAFESVTRCRRLIQSQNPYLQAEEVVEKGRFNKQQDYENYALGNLFEVDK